MYQMKKGGSAKTKKQQAAIAISMKKAGKKPKKMAMGGSLKDVDASKNPGLAKLPTEVRNKMGYKQYGGSAKMGKGGSIGYSKKMKMGGPAEGKPVVKGIKQRAMEAYSKVDNRPAPAEEAALDRKMRDPRPQPVEEAQRDREIREKTRTHEKFHNSLMKKPKAGAGDYMKMKAAPYKKGGSVGSSKKPKMRMGGSCGTPKSLRKGK